MKQLKSGVILAGVAVAVLEAQSVQAATATRVIGVRLNPTARGFNVMLETATGGTQGSRPQVVTNIQSNATVAAITNTQLNLPQGNSFHQDNPAPGIASIAITQLDPSTIKVVVTGTKNAPKNDIALSNAKGITLSFSQVLETAPSLTANTPAVQPASPQLAQTPTPRSTNVLVPNPEITIDGKAVSQRGTEPNSPAPTLPRAIAPPVGDIAISNTDSSPTTIDLGTNERVPRLVLRDAPVREVLTLLARSAGLNLVYTGTATTPVGGQAQPAGQPTTAEGPTVSLDIENESVQDVFNYVLRLGGLQANRNGNTILVGTTLPNEARNVIVRSFRLNQVQVGVALNFLVGFGAESAVSRERVITSVSAVPVGGSATPATQTQTSTETRIETQRINFQDAVPLLRGLQAIGDERTNSVTLIGSPKLVDMATTQLTQLDARRRQVAVNVKIVDVNLLATQDFNTSFSFGIGNNFFSVSNGRGNVNIGGVNPPTSSQVTSSTFSPPIVGAGSIYPGGTTSQPFLDLPNSSSPFGNTSSSQLVNGAGTVQVARAPFGTSSNPLQAGVTAVSNGSITYGLPTLFQFPTRFLSSIQAQVVSGNAKILTDPTLIVQEGQQANVNLTQQVVGNVNTQTNFTAGAAIQTVNVTKENVGLTLSIRIERIDDNGFISLSVAPVVRAPGSSQTINLGSGNSQTIVLINERSLNSGLIRLRDSQTLILSGIIQDSDQTTVSKVPILGDIPILGALFRSTNKNHQRQEVIVLVTPQILDDSMRASYGYNYTPGPEIREILENRGLKVPGKRR